MADGDDVKAKLDAYYDDHPPNPDLVAALQTVWREVNAASGGAQNPFNMMQLFDKQLQIRMGQANVRRWIPDLMPLIEDESDPLGTEDLATHKLPLDDAPRGYEIFKRRSDGCLRTVFHPQATG